MNDNDFMLAELRFSEELTGFIAACEAFGVDPQGRIDDLLFNAGIDLKASKESA